MNLLLCVLLRLAAIVSFAFAVFTVAMASMLGFIPGQELAGLIKTGTGTIVALAVGFGLWRSGGWCLKQ